MEGMFSSMFGVGVADGVPHALAISVLTSGASEAEARGIMEDVNEDPGSIEAYIESMRSAGYFSPVNTSASEEEVIDADGSTFLWQSLKRELSEDESGFKHRIVVLDNAAKNTGGFRGNDLSRLCEEPASSSIPFSAISNNCPWGGCIFASSSVLLLISNIDPGSKRKALKPIAKSLGGCTLPPSAKLAEIRWPYELTDRFAESKREVETTGGCIALHISLTDVEIMRNPATRNYTMRPGTFAHSCIMTISPVGVYLFQAYGPKGYTLLQNIQDHDDEYPLSFAQADEWVGRFEELAAELGGAWTAETNAAYKFCFGVDLVKMGNMRIGSQMDLFFKVYSFPFDTGLVQRNFALLPQSDSRGRKIRCLDGVQARSTQSPPPRHRPDGGVAHYYVPLVLRCASCGNSNSLSANTRCARCKIVHYCSKECQVRDWKLRHRQVCKSLGTLCEK
jgi:hypothetical protein